MSKVKSYEAPGSIVMLPTVVDEIAELTPSIEKLVSMSLITKLLLP